MAANSSNCDLDLLLDCDSVHSDDDDEADNTEQGHGFGSTNLVTFMHSYAAEAEGGSETDTGSDMGVTGATGCDMEADTKPDAMSDNNPVAVPVPTNMMRNSKNKEFRTKTITKVAILNDTYKPKAKKKALLQKEKKSRETSYSLFMRTKREAVIQEYHLLYSDFKTISKKVGELWNQQSRQEKDIWKKKARRINEGKDICKQTKDIKRKKRKIGSDAHSEQRLNCGHLKPRKSCYICLRFLASQESTAARGFADQQTSASKLAEQQNKKRKLNTQFLDTVVKSKHVQENPLIAAQLSSSSHIDREHSAVGIPILKPAIEDEALEMSANEDEALEMLANEDETLEMSGDQVDVKATITTAAEPSSSEAMTNAKKQVPDTLQPSVHPQDTTQPSVTTSDQSKMNIVMKDVSSNSQVQQLLSKYVAFKEISKDSTNESRIFFVARNQIFNNTKPEEDKTAVSAQAAIDTNDTSSQSKLNIVMKDVSRNSQVQQLLSKYIDPTDRSKDSANESKILLVARNQVSSSTKHEEAKTAVVAQDSSDTNAASDQSKLNIVMKDVSSNSQVQQLLSKYIEPKDGSRDTASESKVLLVARNQISNDAREDMSVVNAKASNDTDAQKNKVCNENNIGQGTAGRTKEVTKATAEETLTNKHLKKFDDRWKCGKKVGNVEDFENQLKECYTLPKYVHKVKIHETSENKSTNAQKKTDISNNKIVIEKSQKVFENRWKCEIKLGESSDFENSLKGFVYLGKSKSETEDLDDRADNNHKRSEKLHRKSESFKLKSQKEGKKTVITYSSSVQEQKTTTVAGKSKSVQESNETVPRDSNKSVKDHMKRRRMKRRCQKCKACLREKDCRKCSYCLDRKAYGGSGTLRQKCKLRQCEKWRHAAVLENKIKSKGVDHIPEHPATRSFNVKECKSREPGMTVFKVTEHKSGKPVVKAASKTEHKSDKQVVKAANKTGQKSAGSKTKHSKVTKRIIDEPQEMRMVLRNQDLENPRRSTRLSDKCGGRWKEMKERNEDRKKRSDFLRKKLRDQHEVLREKQTKIETGLKKSVAITTKDKGTTLKNRKTNSNKVEDNIGQDSNESIANRLRGGKEKIREIVPDKLADLEKKRTVKNSKTNLGSKTKLNSKTKFNKEEDNETQGSNENIANRPRGGKEIIKEVVSDKPSVVSKSPTINQMPEIKFKDSDSEKQLAQKHNKKLLDTTDALLSEHQKKLESQKALVRQHAFFGSLKWKKGSCGYCLACRRDTNCGKCRHCKDMRQFGGSGTKKQKCKLRICIKEKKKIKTATKGLENSEQASNDQRNKRSEPLMNGLENTKQSEKPNTRNTKQDTVPEKDLEEMNNNKDRKLRSKEQIDTTKSNIHDKKHAVVNKYDPVRAKAKVITKKAKERGQKLKKKSEADKGAASKQNQDSQQLRRSLREAKITNFKDLFRDPFKKSESLEKVVPKQKDKVNKSITGIEHLLNKKLNENPVVDTTKTLIQPSLNIAPQASNIKFIDPKSVVKRLTQLKEKQRCGRSKRTCEKCGPCKRKDDCGICRFCLDKVQFGGPNTKKKKCLLKQCEKLGLHKQDMPVQSEPPAPYPEKLNTMTDDQGVQIKVERDDEMIPEVSGTTSYQPWSLNRVGLYTPGGIEEKSIFIPQVSFVDKENDQTIVSQSGAYLAPNRPVMLSSPSSAASSKLVSLLPPPRTLSSQSFGASSKFVVLSHPTTLGSQTFSASSSETVMNTDEGVNGSVKGSSQVNDSPVKLNSCYTASDIANPMKGNPNEKVFFFMHKCGCNIMMNISDGYAMPIGFRSKCGSVENCEWFRSQGKTIDDKSLPTVTYKPGLAASGNEPVMNTDKTGDTSVTASSPADSSMVKVKSRYKITINPMKRNPDEQNGLLRHKCGCIAVMSFSTGYAMPIGLRSQCSRPNRSCDWFRSRGMYKNVPSMYKPAVDNSATPKVEVKKKRAVSGFVLFSSAERKAMSTEKTQLGFGGFGEISKMIGEKWRNLSADERKNWNIKAKNQAIEDQQRKMKAMQGQPEAQRVKVKKKRAVYGFLLFSKAMRKSLCAEEPQLGPKKKKDYCELGKRIGEMWRNLSEEEKQQWNKKADEHNEAKQWNVNKTAEKQHSPEEALGQKALQELSEAQQCGEVPMEFKIEMIDDSIENNVLVSNNVSVSSNVSVGKGDCRAYNATNELSGPSRMVNVGNVEMASWQNRDRSLNSDLTGICAIEPGRTTLNQTYDEFCLPSSEIKTEPMDEGNSYPKVCDNANSITLHDKQGPCENLEEHNFEAGKNNGAQEFENDWLRQNNIVIKKEPEDECTEQDSRISSAVSESPMELCGGQGVSDDKTSPEKVIDDNLRENSDSVQISNDLKGDSLSDPAEIKSEPVDGDYGGT